MIPKKRMLGLPQDLPGMIGIFAAIGVIILTLWGSTSYEETTTLVKIINFQQDKQTELEAKLEQLETRLATLENLRRDTLFTTDIPQTTRNACKHDQNSIDSRVNE